jgi:hypothetical protein
MAEFEFHLDQKHTIWYRNNFVIEADTLEEAKAKVIEMCNTNSSDTLSDDWETMFETAEQITPEENGGEATEELYIAGATGEIIWTNKPLN